MKTLIRFLTLCGVLLLICGNAPPPPNLWEPKYVCEKHAEGDPCRYADYEYSSGWGCGKREYRPAGSISGKCLPTPKCETKDCGTELFCKPDAEQR